MNNNEAAIAIVDFTAQSSPLEPVWPSTHLALLPIAGKALIVYLMEQLFQMGVRHVRVAGSIQQFAVSKRLGNGQEWGLKIRYSDLHGPDLLTQTLLEKRHCFYFFGDRLHLMNAQEWQPHGQPAPGDPSAKNTDGAYWVMESDGCKKFNLTPKSTELYGCLHMHSVASFHEANKSAAAGYFEHLHLPGKLIRDRVSLDWDSSIASSATLGDRITIGKHCLLGKRVTLATDCIIGTGSILSPDVHLNNVTVLPNCFIGRGVKLRDAVVTPAGIFDLRGKFWHIDDPSTIGRSRSNHEGLTGIPTHRFSSIERRRKYRTESNRYTHRNTPCDHPGTVIEKTKPGSQINWNVRRNS